MPVFGLIGGIGFPELIVVLVIVLILFGAGRLPQVLESFGKGIKSFRDAQRDEEPAAPPRQLSEKPVSEAHEIKDKAKS